MRKNLLMMLAALAAAAAGAFAAAALLDREDPAAVVDRADGGEVWGADYFPNITLTTHEGETVRFFDDLIRGKVVAINFMYTYCPDTCPVETARLLQVADLLGDRLGKDVFFYSITVDPDYDTQPVLAAFAESWRIPDGWTFLTGDEEEIVSLRRHLGMRIDDVQSGNLADHTVSLLIGNQTTGRWMKRSPFENAHVLALQLGSWLHGWKLPSKKKLAYEDAPELRTISDGEYIFRNSCSACHTIGGGDLHDLRARRIGPDLLHVTRQRDREWLKRWIMEPDAMLEEGDPLATALYEQWNRLPMPNMRLSEKDAQALLGYMERESRRIEAVRSGQLVDHSQMDHGEMDHSQMDHGAMDHGPAPTGEP